MNQPVTIDQAVTTTKKCAAWTHPPQRQEGGGFQAFDLELPEGTHGVIRALAPNSGDEEWYFVVFAHGDDEAGYSFVPESWLTEREQEASA